MRARRLTGKRELSNVPEQMRSTRRCWLSCIKHKDDVRQVDETKQAMRFDGTVNQCLDSVESWQVESWNLDVCGLGVELDATKQARRSQITLSPMHQVFIMIWTDMFLDR